MPNKSIIFWLIYMCKVKMHRKLLFWANSLRLNYSSSSSTGSKMLKSHCRTLSDISPARSVQSLPQCLSWRSCVYIDCHILHFRCSRCEGIVCSSTQLQRHSFFFKPPLCSGRFELKISQRFLSKELPSSWPLLIRRHVKYDVLITCHPGNQVNG